MPLNDQTINNYLKVYGYKTKLYNLHNFFVVEKTTNIQLPDYKKCIQAYTINKTLSMIEIFKNHPFLIDQLTENDKNIIKNIDVVDTLPVRTEHNKNSDRKRFQIKQKAWCYGRQVLTPLGIKIIDLSDQGIKILLAEKNLDLQKNIELLIFFESDNKIVYCKVKPCWSKYDQIFGCQVIESNLHWDNFCNLIYEELSLGKNIHRLAPKKSA